MRKMTNDKSEDELTVNLYRKEKKSKEIQEEASINCYFIA